MKPTAHPVYSCFLLDRDCEIFPVMHSYADQVYDHFGSLTIPNNALVVIGRVQTLYNYERLRQLVQERRATFIFCNAAEGSSTIRWHMEKMFIGDLARSNQLPVVTGGDLPEFYTNLPYQEFLIRMLTNKVNICARFYFDPIFDRKRKPNKILFLNGRARLHRKYLIERLDQLKLLDSSIWSCLEGSLIHDSLIHCNVDGQDLLKVDRPVKFLPVEYEVRQHRDRVGQLPSDGNTFAKYHLFNGEWSDGELTPAAYWDSYFSLVTETVFEDRETFLTEKIWKPILIGHPWIVVANPGVYRSLRNMGFMTFRPLIDESFDQIDDPQARIERITDVVADLCKQDLDKFLEEVRYICKYNQEHFFGLAQKYIADFPKEFFDFAIKHKRN